jgi:hypothetical protein
MINVLTTNRCFVLMPRGNYYDVERRQSANQVYDAVLDAAREAQLVPEGMDRIDQLDFRASIIDQTQSSEIIIADCSPQSETKRPDINVIYGLGIAHALGRPTILLTTDPETLPADLRHKAIGIVYDPTSPQGLHALSAEIQTAIARLRSRAKDRPIDPDLQRHGTQAASARDPNSRIDFVLNQMSNSPDDTMALVKLLQVNLSTHIEHLRSSRPNSDHKQKAWQDSLDFLEAFSADLNKLATQIAELCEGRVAADARTTATHTVTLVDRWNNWISNNYERVSELGFRTTQAGAVMLLTAGFTFLTGTSADLSLAVTTALIGGNEIAQSTKRMIERKK